MTTAEERSATGYPDRAARLDLVATGVALTGTLVGLFVLCDLTTLAWPTAGLAHGWVRLFASAPEDWGHSFAEGVLGSAAGAWVATVLFVPVYNRLARR